MFACDCGSTAQAPVCTFPKNTAYGGDHYVSSGVVRRIVNQLQGNITLFARSALRSHCSLLLFFSKSNVRSSRHLSTSSCQFFSQCCLITCLDATAVQALPCYSGHTGSTFLSRCIFSCMCTALGLISLPRGILAHA